MERFRWIVFVPAFIIGISIGESICEISINYLVDFIFPLNSLWDWFTKAWLISILIFLPTGLIACTRWLLNICPNEILGARLIAGIALIIFPFHYIKTFHNIPNLRIFLDALMLFVVFAIAFSFKKKVYETNELSPGTEQKNGGSKQEDAESITRGVQEASPTTQGSQRSTREIRYK